MLLTVGDGAHSPQVVAASHHYQVTRVKLDEVLHFSCGDVENDGVVDLDKRVGVADSAAIPRHDERNTLGAHRHTQHSAQFVLGLLSLDAVHNESSLDVVQDAEELICSINGDHILETAGVCLVCAHLAVHFDEALHDDLLALVIGEGVLQTVTQQDGHGQALSRPVRSGAGLGGKVATKLVQHP
eukprot:GHVL01038194.1.p2 GENE.GHVL01038194.1~~GHVL01038194.1.p2  ORF type:complete len:185 (-),score=14.15 GHVL01038194.1:87-641(-)